MSDEKIRFTIEVDGSPRNLFSVSKRKVGDLLIGLPPDESLRSVFGEEEIKDKIKHQKFSVHLSSRAVDSINVITHQVKLESGADLDLRTVTYAIKKTNSFVILFSNRRPDMSTWEIVKPEVEKNKTRQISIGGYDPSLYTLHFSVLVGPKGRIFCMPQQAESYVKHCQCEFGDFELIVIWSFSAIHSHPNHALTHAFPNIISILNKNESDLYAQEHLEGYDEMGCLACLFYAMIRQQKEIADFASRQFRILGSGVRVRTRLGFFSNGFGDEEIKNRIKLGFSFKSPISALVGYYNPMVYRKPD